MGIGSQQPGNLRSGEARPATRVSLNRGTGEKSMRNHCLCSEVPRSEPGADVQGSRQTGCSTKDSEDLVEPAVTSSHSDLAREEAAVSFPPSKISHRLLFWSILTQNHSRKGILGNVVPASPN